MRAALVAAIVGLSGCASITQGTTQAIAVQSPAPCVATRNGEVLDLAKVCKSKDDIILVCGNATKVVSSSTDPLAVVGAVLLDGGLVDMWTGAMWKYPEVVEVK